MQFWAEKICTQKKISMSLDKDKPINYEKQLNVLKVNGIFITNRKNSKNYSYIQNYQKLILAYKTIISNSKW